jgi:hypothetical protein
MIFSVGLIKFRTAPFLEIPSTAPETRHGDSMDLKLQDHVTRKAMKDRIRERLNYLQMHDNNATIPLLATEVAVRKVEEEITEIVARWKEGK